MGQLIAKKSWMENLIISLGKAKGFEAILSVLATYLSAALMPIADFVAIVFVLMFFDLMTGIWAAIVRKEVIASKKLRKSVGKFIAYMIAILLSLIMQNLLPSIPIAKAMTIFIASIEFVSNMENLSKITNIDFATFVSNLIKVKFTHKKK